jgi:hypothetical protein
VVGVMCGKFPHLLKRPSVNALPSLRVYLFPASSGVSAQQTGCAAAGGAVVCECRGVLNTPNLRQCV